MLSRWVPRDSSKRVRKAEKLGGLTLIGTLDPDWIPAGKKCLPWVRWAECSTGNLALQSGAGARPTAAGWGPETTAPSVLWELPTLWPELAVGLLTGSFLFA